MSAPVHPPPWHDAAPPPAPPPPRSTRRGTIIVVLAILLVAAVGGLIAQWVVGVGDGADLEARLAAVQEERDGLEADVSALRADAEATEPELSALRDQQSASDACQRSAAIAEVFIADFEEWRQMDAAWWASEEGSAEEANLDLALEAAMSSLRDTAAELKVTSQTCTGEG